jgi:hypothetical protein
MWWADYGARKWHIEFNSAFKGLMQADVEYRYELVLPTDLDMSSLINFYSWM